jgi:hypothetical protein
MCMRIAGAAALVLTVPGALLLGETLTPVVKGKVEAKAVQLRAWGSDPAVVSAVKAANAAPAAGVAEMTNEKWKTLTVLDPFVRSFTKNQLGAYLKGKQDPQISECFVSAANGAKVAFLAKTSNWSHADKDKHRVPMAGKVWIGPVELDESTGQQQVQVAVPVLDGGRPIGSIVIGLAVNRL